MLSTLTLSRSESFPARRFSLKRFTYVAREDRGAAPVPQDCGHLVLELGEVLGAGRTGVVYAVNVIEAQSDVGRLNAGQELCVKIARPNRCRTLAREAWVYEQLEKTHCAGSVALWCFGFFSAELSSDELEDGASSDAFPLWKSIDFDRLPCGTDLGDSQSDDPLNDEVHADPEVATSPAGSRERSPWVDWKPDAEKSLLTVLVMARGGEKYSEYEDVALENRYVAHLPSLYSSSF